MNCMPERRVGNQPFAPILGQGRKGLIFAMRSEANGGGGDEDQRNNESERRGGDPPISFDLKNNVNRLIMTSKRQSG